MKKIVLDFDDFYDEANILPDLIELKTILPNLKVNLFSIFGKMSNELIDAVKILSWVKVIPHGWLHDTNFEFAFIDKENSLKMIRQFESFYVSKGFNYAVRGFKAPGWQISEPMVEALKENGWWLATQFSDGRYNGNPDGPYQPAIPVGMEYYAFKENNNVHSIHGHTWEVCGNGIKALWGRLINLSPKAEFAFIDEVLERKSGASDFFY